MTPSLGLAMCTYNGARYLDEQLKSIAAQTRKPDSLLVVDDCSSDRTTEIVRDFARQARFPVQLVVNHANLGFVQNFAKAISLCAGDVIVLADQDDVWRPQKLERLEHAFQRTELDACFSDAEVVDEQLRPLRLRLFEACGFGRDEQRRALDGEAFEVLVRHNVVSGGTLAFRCQQKELVLPIPSVWAHDAWVALLIAAVGCVSVLEAPLIQRRQHGANSSGRVKRSLLYRLTVALRNQRGVVNDQLHLFAQASERLQRWGGIAPERMHLLNEKIRHLSSRAQLPHARWARFGPVFSELRSSRYRRFSNGVYSAMRDVVV